eukprot:CAMPEP_0170481862 /NCGR_PEP_ID=MMETSP0208-20121228/2138_1 /TAXON_ID=197538 /ORGANISM="Strombidium inclinatum, Strain S3" /LENGTH=110 /DNA_ID=CAMNT_0010754641 /DNA_START=675 /DNA_END=1007 /DNA_ORIENTATION=+
MNQMVRRKDMDNSAKSNPPKSVLSSKKKFQIMNLLGVKAIRGKKSESSESEAASDSHSEGNSSEEEEQIVLTLDDIDNKNYGILKLFNLVICLTLVTLNLGLLLFHVTTA